MQRSAYEDRLLRSGACSPLQVSPPPDFDANALASSWNVTPNTIQLSIVEAGKLGTYNLGIIFLAYVHALDGYHGLHAMVLLATEPGIPLRKALVPAAELVATLPVCGDVRWFSQRRSCTGRTGAAGREALIQLEFLLPRLFFFFCVVKIF